MHGGEEHCFCFCPISKFHFGKSYFRLSERYLKSSFCFSFSFCQAMNWYQIKNQRSQICLISYHSCFQINCFLFSSAKLTIPQLAGKATICCTVCLKCPKEECLKWFIPTRMKTCFHYWSYNITKYWLNKMHLDHSEGFFIFCF